MKTRSAYLLRKYGISLEELETLLNKQQGRCAICQKHWRHCVVAKLPRYEVMFLHYLYVDHDHAKGSVRGLLCNGCNTAIGMLEEDPVRLKAAIDYLQGSRGSTPP